MTDGNRKMFDDRLLKILDEEVAKEKAKKKKKPILALKKEKSLNYYSGWHDDDMPNKKNFLILIKNPPLKSKNEKHKYKV